jgi:ATP synthase protein I
MLPKKFSFKFVTREGSAFMVGTHIVGGIIAGTMVGYVFDGLFHTSPWGLIIGFLLGVIAGFKNAYGELSRLGSTEGGSVEKNTEVEVENGNASEGNYEGSTKGEKVSHSDTVRNPSQTHK